MHPPRVKTSIHALAAAAAFAVVVGAFACSSAPSDEAVGQSSAAVGFPSPVLPAVPADYDGDGIADPSFRMSDGHWIIDYSRNGFGTWDARPQRIATGGAAKLACPADYDGDGKADLAVKDDLGNWSIDYAANGWGWWFWDATYHGYGNNTGVPVPGDYDGDGKADLAIKGTDGIWSIDLSRRGDFGAWDLKIPNFGGATSVPVPADYDGDGRVDLAVLDTNNRWRIDLSSQGDSTTLGYGSINLVVQETGSPSAIPMPADYDGDGRADIAIFQDGIVKIDFAADGFHGWNRSFAESFGPSQAVADYDGDGVADIASADRNGKLSIDYASGAGFGRVDQSVFEGCTSVEPACGLVSPAGDTSNTYQTHLVGPGLVCDPPGGFDRDPFVVGSGGYYYSLCDDNAALAAAVPRTGPSTVELSRDYTVCNACLPKAPAGRVYAVWGDVVARCGNACF